MVNKEYSKAPYILFLIASIIAILRGITSIAFFIFSNYIPFLSDIFSSIGKQYLYIGTVFSVVGLILGIALLILSSKVKIQYNRKIFLYIGWILAGLILTDFSIEAFLVLIGFLIGVIKYEQKKDCISLLSRFVIILGIFSIIYSIIKYFTGKDMLGIFGNMFNYLSIFSIILGIIIFIISIILYFKLKNNPSKNIFIFSLVLGCIGFFSAVSYAGILLVVIGILGLIINKEKTSG